MLRLYKLEKCISLYKWLSIILHELISTKQLIFFSLTVSGQHYKGQLGVDDQFPKGRRSQTWPRHESSITLEKLCRMLMLENFLEMILCMSCLMEGKVLCLNMFKDFPENKDITKSLQTTDSNLHVL